MDPANKDLRHLNYGPSGLRGEQPPSRSAAGAAPPPQGPVHPSTRETLARPQMMPRAAAAPAPSALATCPRAAAPPDGGGAVAILFRIHVRPAG